ncbi:MAG: hydroxysqualene dehydroxylase HpnE [Gammaproteobacteria bacterium]|nr:hydroxysqualene dehydroxylase HpnE [Gammaproteobacteria bacterium]
MLVKKNIAIIGGGWAGLAAAVELCKNNYKITLFESSPQLGGRARAIKWNNLTLDNGQHLMIGAYQQMLDCLNTIQADTSQLFKQLPHRMLMMDSQNGEVAFDLQLPTYPAPLHLLFGVFNTSSLSLKDKIILLLRFNKLLNTPIKNDISVSEWLNTVKLPKSYRLNLLEPVCLAALTTHPQQASAKAFQSVLQQTFNAPADFTDLLIPTTDLGKVFPSLAESYILQHGGEIKTRCKVQKLLHDKTHIHSLQIDNDILNFDHIILATPAGVSAKLLQDIPACSHISEQINKLTFEPVSTLYIQFKDPVSLPYPMLGMLNGLSEWVFERATSGHNDILAVVISAQGNHLKLSQETLTNTIYNELSNVIKDLPELINSKLIIEKHAAFQCHPDVDKNRPGIDTNLKNLKICGDYVYIEENNQPGLPSTLEGALRSGVKCAQSTIKD